MNDPRDLRWCPHCRRATLNAPLPQLAEDEAHVVPLSPQDETHAFRRKLYCVDCRAIWNSLELPAEALAELLATRDALEDAQRQIAMLRLLNAQQRQAPDKAQRPPLRLAS